MFDFENYMIPLWNTDTVYGESVMFLRDEKNISFAPLMFKPTEIISVTKADMSESYEQGRDWVFKDGGIYLTEGSRIFSFAHDELYPENAIKDHSFRKNGGGYVLFHEAHFFHDRQIAVTYKCEKGGWHGHTPSYAGNLLSKASSKLKTGEKLNLVLFGDSISAGANASGVTGCPPYQPCWGELLAENLRRKTGADISFFNPSVGGQNSEWGAKTARENVNVYSPDLVIIAFGANDGGRDPADFKANIKSIMDTVSGDYPNAEFILVATSVPNKLLSGDGDRFYNGQSEQQFALGELCGKGAVLANITEMQSALYEMKRFIDTTGNNVNHPNDFFHRLYAQYVSCMLIEDL